MGAALACNVLLLKEGRAGRFCVNHRRRKYERWWCIIISSSEVVRCWDVSAVISPLCARSARFSEEWLGASCARIEITFSIWVVSCPSRSLRPGLIPMLPNSIRNKKAKRKTHGKTSSSCLDQTVALLIVVLMRFSYFFPVFFHFCHETIRFFLSSTSHVGDVTSLSAIGDLADLPSDGACTFTEVVRRLGDADDMHVMACFSLWKLMVRQKYAVC